MSIKTISSRSQFVPQMIRDRQPFNTYGALSAEAVKPGSHRGSGHLDSGHREKFFADSHLIDYIVWSYATPIAWHKTDGTWFRVQQKFSVTTSKHQGKLYLI